MQSTGGREVGAGGGGSQGGGGASWVRYPRGRTHTYSHLCLQLAGRRRWVVRLASHTYSHTAAQAYSWQCAGCWHCRQLRGNTPPHLFPHNCAGAWLEACGLLVLPSAARALHSAATRKGSGAATHTSSHTCWPQTGKCGVEEGGQEGEWRRNPHSCSPKCWPRTGECGRGLGGRGG